MGEFICFVLTVTKPFRRADFLAPKKNATVDQDHKFKCKFVDCSKSFRKAKLLHYHMKYFHGVEKATESQQNPVKRHIQTRASLASEKANQERSKRGRTSTGSWCKYLADLFLFFSFFTYLFLLLTAATGRGSRKEQKLIFFQAKGASLQLPLVYFFVEKYNDTCKHHVLMKIN